MHINSTALSTQLQKDFRAIYTLHGDETLLVQEAADAIRQHAQKMGYSERIVLTAAGSHFDWSTIWAALNNVSLFGDLRLVDVRIPSGKVGKDGSATLQKIATHLAKYATHPPTSTPPILLMVSLPKLDKATQQSAWFLALENDGLAIKIDNIERHALPQWLVQRLQQQGQRFCSGQDGQTALQWLTEHVEGNLLAAHQEIQKIALLYPKGELSLANIQSAVVNVARFDVFKLSETWLSGNTMRVERMLQGLQAEGVSEVLVHWALAEEIRNLKRVKYGISTGKNLSMALRDAKIWGNKEQLYAKILPQLSTKHLSDLLQFAHQTDGVMKGIRHPNWANNPWHALAQLARCLHA